MNVIFDIGKVLIDFNFEEFTADLIGEEAAQAVIAASWHDPQWDLLDKGEMDFESVLEVFISKAPQYEAQIRQVFSRIGEIPEMRSYAIPLIKELKSKGHNVYYLSNYFTHLMKAAPQALEFIKYMDGGVFSCNEHITKPDERIYKILCQRYCLEPQECVFIDDTLKNVTAAQALGIRGIHFTGQSPEQLLEQILQE